MSPVRVEIQIEDGEWTFAAYAFNSRELSQLLYITFRDSNTRVFENGSLIMSKHGEEITDYTVN